LEFIVAHPGQDERIAKRASQGEARTDRVSQDRPITENREATDATRLAEKLAILRDVNTKLPQPPEIPGFHLCWLTTNNPSDSLEHRFRLGYELVKPSELPGFALPSQQSGDGASDRVCCNEMVLAKISREQWLVYMKELHHDLPLEQMRSLKESVRIEEDGRGHKMAFTGGEFNGGVSDGFKGLDRTPAPRFVGVG
jgi:hypothetical protein